MFSYIVKRILYMLPTLVGVISITFFISEFVPGGPVDQIQAMLEGKTAFGGAGEVSTTGMDKINKNRKKDPKLEWKLKRVYGLNHNMFVRYLRTIFWFGRDSVISSKEIDDGTTEKFTSEGKNCIILRLDNKYYAYHNKWDTGGKSGEIVYDKEKNAFKSVLDGSLFSYETGQLVGGKTGEGLTHIQVTIEKENGIDEIYREETFGQSLCNFDYWHGFFLLKFGKSINKNKTVMELIKTRLPISISLGVFSFFICYTVCIILGIAKAVKNGTTFDSVTSMVILFGYSIPGFVLAVLLIVLLGPGESHIANLIPLSGLTSYGEQGYETWSTWTKILDYFHHIVAPIVCLSIGSFAVLTILTKNSVLEEIHQLYAVAARARGLSERKVLFKHIFRNSLIPLVTGFPASFLAMFFTGELLIEQIFSLDGLGLLGYNSVMERDFPVIMGSLFFFTILGLTATLIRDICYVIVDPRISFEKSQT